MRELGYGLELEYSRMHSSFTTHPLVNKPQELTSRVWANIKPGIVDFMEKTREDRLKRHRVNIIHERLDRVRKLFDNYTAAEPQPSILPQVADINNMPECRALFLAANDVEHSEQDFAHIASQLPELCERWRTVAEGELALLMSKGPASDRLAQPGQNRQKLELATTYFSSSCGCGVISYPRILVHECLTMNMDPWSDGDGENAIIGNWDAFGQPWSVGLEGFVYAEDVSAAVRCLLATCSLDPDNTTAKEMDERDSRFSCENCWSRDEGALVMTWRMAVCISESKNIAPN